MYVSDRKTKMKNLGRLVGNNFLTNFFSIDVKIHDCQKIIHTRSHSLSLD